MDAPSTRRPSTTSLQEKIAGATSIALRLGSYGFLRWLAYSPLPPIIYALFAIYIPAFISSFLTQAQYDIISDEIEVTVTENEVDDDQVPDLPSTAAHSHNLPGSDGPTHIEEEIEVDEKIVLEEKDPKILRTLLTGIPSPTSAALSLITLLVNVALVVMVTDMVYTPRVFYPSKDLSFARIGYVSASEAKLLIREPDQAKMPIHVSIRNANPIPPYDNVLGWHSVGGVNWLTNETDFTAVLSIPLRSYQETTFEWKTSNNHSGTFTSATRPGHPTKLNDGKFTFLTSSCLVQRLPYKPTEHALAIPGLRYLAQLIPELQAQFMLFLGDFIYVDVPKRFGSSVEDYRMKYRQIYASPDWASVGQNLSWIHVLDDHEIANDYDAGSNTSIYKAAVEPFNHYHTAANPPLAHQVHGLGLPRGEPTYFEFTQGPATFFMLDTRTYRDKERGLPPSSMNKTMLGAQQLADLIAFLDQPVPKGVKWKVVVSSVPFTKNWGGPTSLDTWAGYLGERQKVLEAMWDVGYRGGVGVVVLSGDRHEFAATAFPPPLGGKWPVSATVHEFSTSPLSQFYLPFPTYREVDEEDVMVKYIPYGNSKFGAITIENPDSSDQSLLKFRLFIDGEETWSAVLLSPPNQGGKRRGKDALWG